MAIESQSGMSVADGGACGELSVAPTMRTRERLAVGDSGSFTKTLTEEDVFHFARISGDFNPLHVDEAYAARSIFKGRIAHGILTAGIVSTVLASEIPGVGTIIVEFQIRFLKPVYFGDTITANAVVSEVASPKRVRLVVYVTNQRGEEVAQGSVLVVPPMETLVETPSAPASSRA